MPTSLQMQLDQLARDRWARRGVRLLLRTSSLALALLSVVVGLHLLLGWPLVTNWIMSLALGCIALGSLLVLRPRMAATEVARRLDRRFGLHEQLTTALEVSPQAAGVGAYLHEQSRRTLAQIRRQIMSHQRFPWLDLSLVLTLVPLLVGLLILREIEPARPPTTAEPLPPLVAAPATVKRDPQEPPPPPPNKPPSPEQSQVGVPGPGDAAAAAALANALRDQSVTRPAAEALDRGDTAGAAQSLRDLASQAGGLSDQARAELAQALQSAADQLAQANPTLADQVRASAEGIAPPSAEPTQALERLADAVAQLAQGQQPGQGQGQQPAQGQQPQPAQGQSGGGAGQGSLPGQQREVSRERLGVDGVPLELKGDGSGNTPTSGEAHGQPTAESGTSAGGGGGGGGFSSDSQSGERVQMSDDPLRIPADLRDVVQDYFSP